MELAKVGHTTIVPEMQMFALTTLSCNPPDGGERRVRKRTCLICKHYVIPSSTCFLQTAAVGVGQRRQGQCQWAIIKFSSPHLALHIHMYKEASNHVKHLRITLWPVSSLVAAKSCHAKSNCNMGLAVSITRWFLS